MTFFFKSLDSDLFKILFLFIIFLKGNFLVQFERETVKDPRHVKLTTEITITTVMVVVVVNVGCF